mgnify:CR=1 FL=1
MKRNLVCAFLFALSSAFILRAQTFPNERVQFVKTWQQLVTDEAAQSYLKGDFSQQIKGSLLNETQFKKLVDNCNQLQKKEVPVYPDIYAYLQASILLIEKKVSTDLSSPWQQFVNDYATEPDEKLTNFLLFSVDFFRDFSFYKEAYTLINSRSSCIDIRIKLLLLQL